MAILRKDVVHPGTFQDGPKQIGITADDVKEMHHSVPDLQGMGYRIPVWKEHPGLKEWQAYPVPEADKEKIALAEADPWFAGWVKSSNLGDNDNLDVDFETDDKLAASLNKIGTFVSPQFGRLKIGERVFDKALHHIALTRKPVNQNQTNQFDYVTPVAKKSGKSKKGIDANSVDGQPVTQMSLAEAIDSNSDGVVRFSIASNNMPPASNPQNSNGTNGQADQPNHASDAITRFTEACSALGVQLDSNSPILQNPRLMSRLTGMLADMTGDAASDLQQQQQAMAGANGAPGQPGLTQSSTVVAMSKTGTEPTPTPQAPATTPTPAPVATEDATQMSRMQSALLQQDATIKTQAAQIAGLVNTMTAQSRAGYMSRIANLRNTGRIAADDATSFEAMVGVYQFSGTNPEAKTELDISLAVYEKLPANSIIPMTGNNPAQMSQQYVSTPVAASGFFAQTEPDDKRAMELLDELCPLNPKQ